MLLALESGRSRGHCRFRGVLGRPSASEAMPGGLDAELLSRGREFDPWSAEEEAKGSKSPTMIRTLQRNNVDMARYSKREAPGDSAPMRRA